MLVIGNNSTQKHKVPFLLVLASQKAFLLMVSWK
ncbi:rCG55843 [Rattus norvegicus]|uniref:RCG55843 n=1 Tax=Rattus norvegicus TaxID=10116 RepID=A6JLN0_RAT|nr:rCG55843 [Rattus norvegicus]